MKHDYQCMLCDTTEERNVPHQESTEQYCKCGTKLKKLFDLKSIQFCIPTSFAETGDICAPQNDEERRKWDNDGVSLAKGGRWI